MSLSAPQQKVGMDTRITGEFFYCNIKATFIMAEMII